MMNDNFGLGLGTGIVGILFVWGLVTLMLFCTSQDRDFEVVQERWIVGDVEIMEYDRRAYRCVLDSAATRQIQRKYYYD